MAITSSNSHAHKYQGKDTTSIGHQHTFTETPRPADAFTADEVTKLKALLGQVVPAPTPEPAPAPAPEPVPTPPPSGTNPSGQAMPVGDLPGFRQVFTDDFLQAIPEGQFPAATNGRWGAYPYGWRNSGGTGTYDPKIISCHDSLMDIRLHTSNDGIVHIANPGPILSGNTPYQRYGRYAIRFKADPVDGYKTAWLLWPQDSVYPWPKWGEIDFPEGSLDSTISAFMHRQDATAGNDQDAYSTSARYTTWHTAVTEWTPTRCEFFLDGVSIGKSTSRTPAGLMRWQIQTETDLVPTKPPASAAGHVLIDWVAVWAYVP